MRALTILLVFAAAGEAAAQTPARQPPPAPSQTVGMTVNVSAAAADNSDLFGDGRTIAGWQTDADAQLAYERRAGKLTLGVSGRSVVRYEPLSGGVTTTRQQGTVDISMNGARSQFHATQSASYSPFYQFGFVGAEPASTLAETSQSHADFANARLAAYGSATTVDMRRGIGRRSSLAFTYDLHRTTFAQSDFDLMSQNVGFSFSHRLSRYLSARTGYGYRFAESAAAPGGAIRVHNIDLGLDYSRALSFSRRTTFNFSSGSAVMPDRQRVAVTLTGAAALTRQFGRTWSARLAGNRSVQALEGFSQPVIMNTITGTVGGDLGRRTSMSMSIGLSSGSVGAASGNMFSAITGGVGIHLTLTRRVSLDGQYFYYGHRFDPDVVFAPGFAAQTRRNGVRAGLTWRPLLQSKG